MTFKNKGGGGVSHPTPGPGRIQNTEFELNVTLIWPFVFVTGDLLSRPTSGTDRRPPPSPAIPPRQRAFSTCAISRRPGTVKNS